MHGQKYSLFDINRELYKCKYNTVALPLFYYCTVYVLQKQYLSYNIQKNIGTCILTHTLKGVEHCYSFTQFVFYFIAVWL